MSRLCLYCQQHATHKQYCEWHWGWIEEGRDD